MKFAFVLTNLAGGGAEKTFLTLAAELSRRGHEAHVVLLENRVEHDVPANVTVHAVSRGVISKGFLGKRLAARRLHALVLGLERGSRFDLVVSALPFANEVAILAALPRLWCRIDNTLSVEIGRLRATRPRKAERRLARYRRLYGLQPLVAVSDGVQSDLRDRLGLARTRIERIYNPFDFAGIRSRAGQPASVPKNGYVVHVGRFVAQKRHDVLLDAWKQLATAHLVLLTAPDPRLTQMIEDRGLAGRVTVAGFQPNPYPWIAAADLLVLSSDHEGLPSVIIEALALGTPVVSTDCPSGPREILGAMARDCLVPVGDPESLAQAIRRALTSPPDIAGVDLAAYTLDSVAAAYERLARESTPR